MVKAEFNLSDHIGVAHEEINFFEKKDYSSQVNLSSNQLEHPELLKLFQKFIADFDPSLSCQYLFLKAITDQACDFYNLSLGQLLFSAGSDVAISQIVKSFTLKNRSIILQTPNYITYKDQAILNGIDIIAVDFLNKSEIEHVEETIQLVVKHAPTMLIIANPNNSLGTCLSFESIKKLAKICLEHNAIFILDEAYCFFSKFNHISLIKDFPNIIIIRTFSKSHGMAGLRLGCVIGHQDIIYYLKKSGIERTVSAVSLHYFKYLMQHEQQVVSIRNEVIAEREAFGEWLRKYLPNWHVFQSNTNFITIEVGSPRQAKDIVDHFISNNIAIKLLSFDDQPTRLIRISVGAPLIMQKIKDFFTEIMAKECM